MLCLVAQSCPDLCGPRYYSPPGSSAHEVFLARTVEWIAVSYSRGSSWPRDGACIPCISCTGKWILHHWQHRGSPPTGEVWSMHNVDTQCTLRGERLKGRENAFCLNFSWLAIKYEFNFMWEVRQAKHYFPHRGLGISRSWRGLSLPCLGQLRVGSIHFLRVTGMKGGREGLWLCCQNQVGFPCSFTKLSAFGWLFKIFWCRSQ